MAKVNKKRIATERNCKDCAHSIFCETWGEVKCMKHELRKYDPTDICEDYTEDLNKEEKSCHCETCEERIVDDDT